MQKVIDTSVLEVCAEEGVSPESRVYFKNKYNYRNS